MHSLPQLKYSYKDLEPYIDEATMDLHHSKHHAGYVEKLNKALEDQPDFRELSLEDLLTNTKKLPVGIRQSVINNAGGHANHTLFWEIMTPGGTQAPDELKTILDKSFSSVDKFKEQFTQKALDVFGSGWVFLVVDGGKLSIKRHSFQNSPLMHDVKPILALDVWEHAYYLKYQNRRVEYIDAWWNIVNWNKVLEKFESSK